MMTAAEFKESIEKADEMANKVRAQQPRFYQSKCLVASVKENGNLEIGGHRLNPDEALRLRAWLGDMFCIWPIPEAPADE